jgi:hypothetical protein
MESCCRRGAEVKMDITREHVADAIAFVLLLA